MRILFYNHTGKVSGAEGMLLTILRGLDRSRFVTVLLCPEEGSLAQLALRSGVNWKSIPPLDARFTLWPHYLLRYLYSFARTITALRRQVVMFDPDLLHANSIRSGLVATAATLGLSTRVVWHLHDLLPRHPLSSVIRLFAFLFRRAEFIAVSKAVADNFAGRSLSLKHRVRVILNGIEVDRFGRNTNVRQATRRELGLSYKEVAIGIVGLLTERKGQLGVITAFSKVVESLPHARLFIVGSAMFAGDEMYEQILRKTVCDLGLEERVSFLGLRTDIPELMQSFDLLVMNSSVEPFGLVLLEAMAGSTPVVAANTGGVPEIIENRRNGLLVEEGNSVVLARAITYLLKNPEVRARFTEQAKRDVARKFSHQRVLYEIQNLYEAPQRSIVRRLEVRRKNNDSVIGQFG